MSLASDYWLKPVTEASPPHAAVSTSWCCVGKERGKEYAFNIAARRAIESDIMRKNWQQQAASTEAASFLF